MWTTIGLIAICVSWFCQFMMMLGRKNNMVSSLAVMLYVIGVALLVVNDFMMGMASVTLSTWLNVIALVFSFLVLMLSMRKMDMGMKM